MEEARSARPLARIPIMKYFVRASILLAFAASPAAPQETDELQKNTSHVRVYPSVEQLVRRADALAAEGKFNEALEIYADAQSLPNALVPAEVKSPAPPRYVGVLEFCLRRIAAWPPEGRAAARRHSDPAAGQDRRPGEGEMVPAGVFVDFRGPPELPGAVDEGTVEHALGGKVLDQGGEAAVEFRQEVIAQAGEVVRAIGSEYVVTYRPKRPLAEAQPGEYRKLQVASRRVGLSLHARRGYVVPTP